MSDRCLIYTSREKIDVNVLDFVFNKKFGAVVSFFGVVRECNNNKNVKSITYHVFEELMYSIIAQKCSDLLHVGNDTKICIIQCSGDLNIGDINLIVGVGSKHRKKAFLYCNQMVEFIKKSVPIWKKEFYCDGTFEWINS